MPLVRAATMEAMLERLYADDAPLAVVLGFRPVVPGAYGRIIAGRGGMIEKMVEYMDASEDERAVTLCNSGLMAVRPEDLFTLLERVENTNAAGDIGIASCRERVCQSVLVTVVSVSVTTKYN